MVLSSLLSLSWLIRVTGRRCIFPFYHTVSDRPLLHIQHLYEVRGVAAFERDLDFLLKHYKPIDVGALDMYWKEGQKHNVFLLTFDDGLREFYDVVAPILLRKGVPAVCFLNSAFVDNKALFFRYKVSLLRHRLLESRVRGTLHKAADKCLQKHGIRADATYKCLYGITYSNRGVLDELAVCIDVSFEAYLQHEQPYLTTEQVHCLRAQGFVFGAHTTDHPMLAELSYEEQYKQVQESVDYVQQYFPSAERLFSFPFTDWGVSVKLFDAIHTGEVPLVNYSFGTAGIKKDTYKNHIQRIPMEVGRLGAEQVLLKQYVFYLAKWAAARNTVTHPLS
jgi:peptidoglycan/xylan/chitin deacetylase (PgdA/CDA1 family)